VTPGCCNHNAQSADRSTTKRAHTYQQDDQLIKRVKVPRETHVRARQKQMARLQHISCVRAVGKRVFGRVTILHSLRVPLQDSRWQIQPASTIQTTHGSPTPAARGRQTTAPRFKSTLVEHKLGNMRQRRSNSDAIHNKHVERPTVNLPQPPDQLHLIR
jgi:hypothetical protein